MKRQLIPMNVKTRGIVLKQTRYGDTTAIVNLYTEHMGRVAVIVRGITRGKKPPRTALFQSLTILEAEISVNRKNEVQQLRSYSLNYVPLSIPHSVTKSSVTIFLAEVLSSVLREESSDQALFSYLETAIQFLDQTDAKIANFHLMFLVKLTRYLGFSPAATLNDDERMLDLVNGVFLTAPPLSGRHANQQCSSLISKMAATPFSELATITTDPALRRETTSVLLKYYSHHIPAFKKINSPEILFDIFR